MKLNGRTGSRSRRAVGRGSEDLQPKLFDVPSAPAKERSIPLVSHTKQQETKPVDFKGANEYCLPTHAASPDQLGNGEEIRSAGDDLGTQLPLLDQVGRYSLRETPPEASEGERQPQEHVGETGAHSDTNEDREKSAVPAPENDALLDQLAKLLLSDLEKQKPPA